MESFIVGIMIGVAVGVFWSFSWVDDYYPYASQSNKAMQQCEAELSRNQHCKLIAVPEGDE